MVARGRPSPGHSQARTALFCIAVLVSNVLVFVMYQVAHHPPPTPSLTTPPPHNRHSGPRARPGQPGTARTPPCLLSDTRLITPATTHHTTPPSATRPHRPPPTTVAYQNSVMTRYITSANAYSASRTDYELEKVLLALEKARQEVAPAAPAAPAATLAQPPPLLPPPPPTQPSVPPPPPKPDVEPEPKPKPKPDPKLEPKLKLDLARGLDLHIDFEESSWSESKFKNSGSRGKSFETVEGYFKDRSGKVRRGQTCQ